MTDDKVKVLYIAGMGRSGSTILGRLLGELPSAVDVGELGLIFSPKFQQHGHCGCHKPIQECEFWEAVFDRAFGGMKTLDLEAMHQAKQSYRLRSLPRLLLPSLSARQKRQEAEYLAVLGALYRAIAEVSGARVIVDATKHPLYAYALRQSPLLDLRAVHLVRDCRAVAHSYLRVKRDPPIFANPGELTRMSPLQTALLWSAVNSLLDLRKISPQTLFLRYEDIVASPGQTEAAIGRIWSMMDEPAASLEFLRASPIRLSLNHTIAGNPDRFQQDVQIRPDLEWQRKMSPQNRRLVTALAWPTLLRYGYLRPASADQASGVPVSSSRVL